MSAKSQVENMQKPPDYIGKIALFLFGMLFLASLAGFVSSAEPKTESNKTVSLTFDYADGVEKRFKQIPWRKGMTVLDVMKYAKKHARGITYNQSGSGSIAFIKQIDDLKNQGRRGKNWVYRVNNKLGDTSFAIYALKAGDAVLWKFDKYP